MLSAEKGKHGRGTTEGNRSTDWRERKPERGCRSERECWKMSAGAKPHGASSLGCRAADQAPGACHLPSSVVPGPWAQSLHAGPCRQDMNKGPWELPWPDSSPTAPRAHWGPCPGLTYCTAHVFHMVFVENLLYLFKCSYCRIHHTFCFFREAFPDH